MDAVILDLILIRRIILDDKRIMGIEDNDMRYRYPRHKFPKSDAMHLDITLHGESMVDVISNSATLIEVLVNFQDGSLVSLITTPFRPDQDKSLQSNLKNINQLSYEDHESKFFGGKSFKVSSVNSGLALASDNWSADVVERVFKYPTNTLKNIKMQRLLKDLEAHRAIDADIFVTEDQDALALRDLIQNHIPVLILSLNETLDYIDVHLKRHGSYLASSNMKITDRRGYYWERLYELVPTLSKTWITAVVAEEKYGSLLYFSRKQILWGFLCILTIFIFSRVKYTNYSKKGLPLIGILVSFYGYKLAGKLKSLSSLAERISVGELEAKVEIQSKDEIGDLAEAISRMQESIRLSIDRLRMRK